MTTNPAGMARRSGTTVQVDVTAIDLNYQFEGTGTAANGTMPMTGGDGGNAGAVTPVPAMSVVHKFDNGLALGAMVSAPFGLKTEYEDGWQGRYFAHTSDVKIVDLTLSAAVDVIPEKLSVGVGAIFSRAMRRATSARTRWSRGSSPARRRSPHRPAPRCRNVAATGGRTSPRPQQKKNRRISARHFC